MENVVFAEKFGNLFLRNAVGTMKKRYYLVLKIDKNCWISIFFNFFQSLIFCSARKSLAVYTFFVADFLRLYWVVLIIINGEFYFWAFRHLQLNPYSFILLRLKKGLFSSNLFSSGHFPNQNQVWKTPCKNVIKISS